ncbi:MAG: zinc ribbon domain-containing protein [Nocardioides sp.]|uniref:zinc ribbon domain-containing protein n=1 Tax=Nocardioides sp. TaxID=35761 RepID=UPI0026035142|nr:zinc ribbon domain-containing protein [Nocardioides sp.]
MTRSPYDTRRSRTVLLVVGSLLLVGGAVIAYLGGRDFFAAANMESMDPQFGSFFTMAGGAFMVIFGIGMLNAGTLGAQSRYVAGETMPTVKKSAEYLSDGQGIMGVGRTVDDGAAAGTQRASGPFCRACGTRNDEDARFCDGCGASMA